MRVSSSFNAFFVAVFGLTTSVPYVVLSPVVTGLIARRRESRQLFYSADFAAMAAGRLFDAELLCGVLMGIRYFYYYRNVKLT